jgi:hypothetical protein
VIQKDFKDYLYIYIHARNKMRTCSMFIKLKALKKKAVLLAWQELIVNYSIAFLLDKITEKIKSGLRPLFGCAVHY